MRKFFSDLLLEQGGIYTMLGSKPMTVFPIYNFTDEENEQAYQKLKQDGNTDFHLIEEYDLYTNWKKWENIRNRYPLTKYILFSQSGTSPKAPEVVFINIKELALTLQKHYALISDLLNITFDPLQVVFEAQDPESKFWKAVRINTTVKGILYGYGIENAICFAWKYDQPNSPDEEKFRNSLQSRFSDTTAPGSATISDFPIPKFASFIAKDPTITKYQNERKKIIETYTNKDFLPCTLKTLTAKTSSP